MDFSNKVVIVTGSSSGIGAAVAKLFSEHGALLAIMGRNEKRLAEVAHFCTEARGNKPLSLLRDLTLPNSCEEVVGKTIEYFGKIDILVNCVGKIIMTSVFDNSMDNFDELFALNLRVPYKMTQLCVPHLKNTRGNIVNVYGAPMRVKPGFLAEIMIRDALERFTKTGALELVSEGVRMNAVRVGLTRTNIMLNLNLTCIDEAYKVITETVPNKTIIEPEEIARMVLFVASDTCPNLIASNIILDAAASSL